MTRLTIDDISEWINNDEGLHAWWRRSKMSKRAFIREHRQELETAITNINEGKQQAHYLKYGRRDPSFHEAFEQPPQAPSVPASKPMLSPPAVAALAVGGVAVVGFGLYWLLSKPATSAAAAAGPPGPTGGASTGATWTGGSGPTGGATGPGATGPTGPGATGPGATGPTGPVQLINIPLIKLNPAQVVTSVPITSGTVLVQLPPATSWKTGTNTILSDHVSASQYTPENVFLTLDGSPAVAKFYWTDGTGVPYVADLLFTSGTPSTQPSITLDPSTTTAEQTSTPGAFAINLPQGATFTNPPHYETNGSWNITTGVTTTQYQLVLDGTSGFVHVPWSLNGQHYVTDIVFVGSDSSTPQHFPVPIWGGGGLNWHLVSPSPSLALDANQQVQQTPSVSGTISVYPPPGDPWDTPAVSHMSNNILKVVPYADHVDVTLDGNAGFAVFNWLDAEGGSHPTAVLFTTSSSQNNFTVILPSTDGSVSEFKAAGAGKMSSFGIGLPAGAIWMSNQPIWYTNGRWNLQTAADGSYLLLMDGSTGAIELPWADNSTYVQRKAYIIFD